MTSNATATRETTTDNLTTPPTTPRDTTAGEMATGERATGARAASLRPFGRPSRLWWLAIVALAMVVLAGIAAWVVQLRGGMAVAG